MFTSKIFERKKQKSNENKLFPLPMSSSNKHYYRPKDFCQLRREAGCFCLFSQLL
nr:MAG TPA: hypothetical protein [Bacteriophage sp.]